MAHDILIIDDETDIRKLISGILKDEGYTSRTAADGAAALEEIKIRRPRLVILDVWLNDARYDGISLLDILHHDHPDMPVIMISGHGTIETAVAAIKKGAYDFIEKPFKSERLLLVIQRAIEAATLKKENEELRQRNTDADVLVGNSPAILQLKQWLQKVSMTNSRILLTGSDGTGKELVARQIHDLSSRAQGSFMVVNCAMSENLDQDLFGSETGRSWGTGDIKVGQLEKSHMGTLLLTEVGFLSLENQNKLLKFLQDNHFCRIGGGHKVAVDVRIIATTSEDLEGMNEDVVKKGGGYKFHPDLYARLKVVTYETPSLKQRREDIPELARLFMSRSAATHLRSLQFSEESMVMLQSYDWPGDLNQLRNAVDWAVIMASCENSSVILPSMLPPEINGKMPQMITPASVQGIVSFPLREAREFFEKYYLTLQLNRFGSNISQTAHFIGMERSALHRKLKSLGIRYESYGS